MAGITFKNRTVDKNVVVDNFRQIKLFGYGLYNITARVHCELLPYFLYYGLQFDGKSWDRCEILSQNCLFFQKMFACVKKATSDCLHKTSLVCYNVFAMKVYDFDKTIFKGNSLQRFCIYNLIRLPYLILLFPYLIVILILHGARVLDKEHFFHGLELYLKLTPNLGRRLSKFWHGKIQDIKPWYLQQKQPTDVILSATPQVVVQPACEMLGVTCIATVGNKHCYGANKIDYFRESFGDVVPEEFYSDSLSDFPMMKYAHRGYLVKGNNVVLYYQDGKCLYDVDERKLARRYK